MTSHRADTDQMNGQYYGPHFMYDETEAWKGKNHMNTKQRSSDFLTLDLELFFP